MKKILFVFVCIAFLSAVGCSSSSSKSSSYPGIPDNWDVDFTGVPASNSCHVGDVYNMSVTIYDENNNEVSEDDYDYSSITWFVTKGAGTLSNKKGRTNTLTITTVCKDAEVGVQFKNTSYAVGFNVAA